MKQKKGKKDKSTPHLSPLPQVERKEKERKGFNNTLTFILSHRGREKMKEKILRKLLTLFRKVEKEERKYLYFCVKFFKLSDEV
jgi:hypothetical protein